MSPKRIPNHPNLDQCRKQAKELLKAYQSGEAQAIARFRQDHPRGNTATGASPVFQLSDAQWVVARERGFESWPKFVRHLDGSAQPGESSDVRPASVRLTVPTSAHSGSAGQPTAHEVNLGVFLHDHLRILTATEAEPVRLWDAATGKLRHEFGSYSNHAWALKPSADDQRLIVGCRDGSLRVVDMGTEHVVQTLTGHRALVRCIDATADLKLVISGTAMRDHDLRLWDVPSGECTQQLKGQAADERQALSCSQDIRLWDITTGKCLRIFEGHTETIRSVAWSPDQRHAVSAAHDNTVRVWDVDSGECVQTFTGHSAGVINAAWTSNRRVASCDWTGDVRNWDLS